MSETTIPWCDYTWNPWRGCDKVSEGCKFCYIVRTPPFRVSGMKHGDPRVRGSEATLKAPFEWAKKPWICDLCGKATADKGEHFAKHHSGPRCETPPSFHRARVFLGSLMDIFDTEAKIEWLAETLVTVNDLPEIDFLLVTKRPELWFQRIMDVVAFEENYRGRPQFARAWSLGRVPPNVWMITSTENQKRLDERVPHLLCIPAKVHGLSCEPLLGPIQLKWPYSSTARIDWVIAGGESGPQARPCNAVWIRDLQEQCHAAGVPYFAKQLGQNAFWHGDSQNEPTPLVTKNKKGEDPSEWPEDMRVREWPDSSKR